MTVPDPTPTEPAPEPPEPDVYGGEKTGPAQARKNREEDPPS
jgi:hypothetical protein